MSDIEKSDENTDNEEVFENTDENTDEKSDENVDNEEVVEKKKKSYARKTANDDELYKTKLGSLEKARARVKYIFQDYKVLECKYPALECKYSALESKYSALEAEYMSLKIELRKERNRADEIFNLKQLLTNGLGYIKQSTNNISTVEKAKPLFNKSKKLWS